MRKLKDNDGLFNGCHFDREVIVLCVRWYLRYKLSFRDLTEMMAERGLSLARTANSAAGRPSIALPSLEKSHLSRRTSQTTPTN